MEEWIKLLSEESVADLTCDNAAALGTHIETVVFNRAELKNTSLRFKLELVDKIQKKLSGMDILQQLLEDPTINEIMINGWQDIFIERGGCIERLKTGFDSKERLENIVQKMASDVNRFVNKSHPILDLRLKNGERVNVVLDPVSLFGPTVTIRKFSKVLITLQDMARLGNISVEMGQYLKELVHRRFNCFITGGTSSGKTTFLNAMAVCIPPEERIITIEDSAEIQIPTAPNLVRLETRQSNFEGNGEIDMSDLIKTALRMRPDRILVGEVRGSEALSMLQAMNTGHDGSMSTGHANTNEDMLYRLETMILSSKAMPVEAIRRQICSGIDVMIYIRKCRDGKRRVDRIQGLRDLGGGQYRLEDLFILKREEDTYGWQMSEDAEDFLHQKNLQA